MHIEQNYCFDPAAPNPYHTSLHAADVTLTVAHFCENSVSLTRAAPRKAVGKAVNRHDLSRHLLRLARVIITHVGPKSKPCIPQLLTHNIWF